MSYARWGDGSDVYVYAAQTPCVIFICAECPRLGRTFRVSTELEMVTHLEQDRAAGFNVPQAAIDRLLAEGGAG